MTDAVTSLRQDVPALGLTLGFSAPSIRPVLADALLFWLEIRRAGLAGEQLIAATRMTWWRDALTEGRSEGVPLAERLIAHGGGSQLAEAINRRIDALLYGDGDDTWPDGISVWLAARIHEMQQDEIDISAISQVMNRLDAGLKGIREDDIPTAGITGQISLDLISWCCDKPSRLQYPAAHPLLVVQMLLATFRLPRKPASG